MKLLPGALRRSLATRILLVFILTSLLIAGVIFGMVVKGFANQWRYNVSPHLAQYLDYINADIGNPPDVNRARQLAAELPINIYVTGPDTSFSSTGRSLDLDDLDFHDHEDDDEHERRFGKRYRPADRLDTASKVEFGTHDDRTVLRNEIGEYRVYYELPHSNRRGHRDDVIFKTLLGIVALLGLCYLLFRRMLRPVQDLKTAVTRMGKGELSYRAPIRADNDLGELAGSINTMADDIEKMLDAKRQLLLGVSHELRSPLTRANIAVQLLDDSPHVRQIRDDLDEMDSLITEILETERINTSHAVIQRTEMDLVAVARSVLSELPDSNVELDARDAPLVARLDEPRIRLLLRNLASNAIKHGASAEKTPVLTLSRNKQTVSIDMLDFGPGIAAEHLDQVTEPFYRADPSRTRATGGFGIGLYLCKLIAEAHQGKLLLSSESGKGTQVRAILSDPP